MDPSAVLRYTAISATVRGRRDYFPPGAEVVVVHPPPHREIAPGGRRGDYVFSVSRLDAPKRLDVLAEAMALTTSRARLKVAGTGPEAGRLAELSAGNPRVELLGRVSDDELVGLYGRSRAVAFLPHDEDFGLVTLRALQAGRPVITTHDAGGPLELVVDGVTGLVVARRRPGWRPRSTSCGPIARAGAGSGVRGRSGRVARPGTPPSTRTARR